MATPNRLISQTSPYLLQHAHNPIDWYPWGEEALSKAKAERKPILVSIGYSACHWCHVMERESFENEQIAALMNANFVCIKVDREERPDVDAIYMDALHAMGIRGGWPLNVFLLPDARPFYGLTYAPSQNWFRLLQSIKQAFDNQYIELEKSAAGFTENMLIKDSAKYGLISDKANFVQEELDEMFEKLQSHFDTNRGGMDRAPKFPMPSIYKFLLRYYAITKNEAALHQIQLSLNSIALGGIYDHVGGGWARYSVDDDWFIPHFEKMLYDNAQLLSIYAEAYTLFKNLPQTPPNKLSTELYRQRIEQTVAWLTREMMHPEGGFYAALDADSEGVEGKFYIWAANELKVVLGDDFDKFSQMYHITAAGNWEHGYNHLHLTPDLDGLWELPSIDVIEKLFEVRKSRVRPGLDNKILASWNGLLLKGLTDVYRALGEEKYRELLLKNANFIKEKLTIKGNQLIHTWHSPPSPPSERGGATATSSQSENSNDREQYPDNPSDSEQQGATANPSELKNNNHIEQYPDNPSDSERRGATATLSQSENRNDTEYSPPVPPSERGGANNSQLIKGFLEDYAAVIEAYIGVYQVTFDENWLDAALQLTAYVIENFFDTEDELFYFTDSSSETLIARKKEVFDNVIPASNSIMAHNLYFLGTIFDHEDYIKLADLMLAKMRRPMLTDVQWATNWAALYAMRVQPIAEIAIVGKNIDAARKEIEQRFMPNKIVVGTTSESDIALLEGRKVQPHHEHTLYLCYNKTCQMPVATVNQLWHQLAQ